jgi:hypothetical protein
MQKFVFNQYLAVREYDKLVRIGLKSTTAMTAYITDYRKQQIAVLINKTLFD